MRYDKKVIYLYTSMQDMPLGEKRGNNEGSYEAFAGDSKGLCTESNEGKYPFRVRSSIGAFRVKLQPGMTLNQCILHSDKMMYEIKRHRHENDGA